MTKVCAWNKVGVTFLRGLTVPATLLIFHSEGGPKVGYITLIFFFALVYEDYFQESLQWFCEGYQHHPLVKKALTGNPSPLQTVV